MLEPSTSSRLKSWRKRAFSLWVPTLWALTATAARSSWLVPYSSMRCRVRRAQKPGPGRPTQRWRRYSRSVSSSRPEVWMKPLGIFSPPTTNTTSCAPLDTIMWPTLNALAPAAQPAERL